MNRLNSGAIRRSLIRVASCPRNEVEIRQTTVRCAETQVFDVVMEKRKGRSDGDW